MYTQAIAKADAEMFKQMENRVKKVMKSLDTDRYFNIVDPQTGMRETHNQFSTRLHNSISDSMNDIDVTIHQIDKIDKQIRHFENMKMYAVQEAVQIKVRKPVDNTPKPLYQKAFFDSMYRDKAMKGGFLKQQLSTEKTGF